ncbi:hypothetical protein [Stackebrandtia nassauensis]|uniref:Lipoprotein n=1 Tax=Stackebrandtia nassauensis (strain DSM 44728 / CIP 108903 / NRRL B-16338 / NBRC 102104 / LLR-40K-21) TaxID=446470 RepID=D3PXX7_STANL|nr:hypothetical protein [Stackebrandtia nassauensis]ADD45306.1 hypothetical protein Snas_5676 [Stackebrandtia nassauensis DSM 44728]
MSGKFGRFRRGVAITFIGVLAAGLAACTGDNGSNGDKDSEGGAKPLAVEYDVPEGFKENKDMKPITPLAKNHEVKYFSLDGKESESIFVASYVIDVDTTDLDRDELLELVRQYDDKVDNQGKGDPYAAVANGHPGFHKWTKQATKTGDEQFITYDAEYFFEGKRMVQVGCQYKDQEAEIAKACRTVLGSLEF